MNRIGDHFTSGGNCQNRLAVSSRVDAGLVESTISQTHIPTAAQSWYAVEFQSKNPLRVFDVDRENNEAFSICS